MNIKDYLPIAYLKRWLDRKLCQNSNFSLITQNCLGGMIYHNLQQQFRSPTINLRVGTARDFYKVCSNLEYYLSLDIIEDMDNKEIFPVGLLGGVKLYFNHYATFDEAVRKWEERKKRVDFDNLYIIATDYVTDNESLSRTEVEAHGKIKCKKLLLLTQVPYDDLPYTKCIGKERMKKMLITNKFTGLAGYELFLNYVKWLNE